MIRGEKDHVLQKITSDDDGQCLPEKAKKVHYLFGTGSLPGLPPEGIGERGLESDQDIFNLIKEIGLQCPLGLQQPGGSPMLKPPMEWDFR